MTPFEWTDREGVLHQLKSPASIGAEVAAVSGEIDQALARMAQADPTRKAELRLVIRSLLRRLQQLKSDGERWDALAMEHGRIEAAALVKNIEQLEVETEPMKIIAVLHAEHEVLMGDIENRDALLAGEMTSAQRMAIRRSAADPKPTADATRAEAHEWLKGDPAFYRPRTDEGGWFEWQDDKGGLHRLASPLRIEKEIASIVHKLGKLLPSLREELSQEETVRAIESANAVTDRFSVLQGDLSRFKVEAEKRDDEEWSKFEKDWTALRGRL